MSEFSDALDEAKRIAAEAGALLREHYSRSIEVRFKGETNLVTDADTASQDLIHGRLSRAFPGHDFLGEEGLEKLSGSDFRWVIDPLDGTTNFAHRLPVFCVSIALEVRGSLACGVVFNPMSGEMFTAERGGGAFLGGNPIRVSSVESLGRALVATGFPYDLRTSRTNIAQHERFLLRSQAVRRCGSAAIDLCYVACGRFDGFWELKLNPWDTAAGAVIAGEAGGRVTDFQGRPVDIYHPEVLASNGLLHEDMLAVLRGS
jgi:myo-inositol-1(or 4)-monophosphatase